MSNNYFVFNNELFSDAIRNHMQDLFSGSNLLKNKLGEKINKLDFNLVKENSHQYKLSVTTNYDGKMIHIDEQGDDVYNITHKLLSGLERKIKQLKPR